MNGPVCRARTRARVRALICSCCLAVGGLVLSACGSSTHTASSANAPGSGASSTAATPAASSGSGCGTVPTLAIHDKSGVITSLGARYKAAYNGFQDTVYPSAYAHWKPKRATGITVGMIYEQPINTFSATLLAATQKDLAAVKGVSHVTVLTTGPTQVAQQLQQMNQLIQQHVDVIALEPIVSAPFLPLIAKAHQEGIAVLSILDTTDSPDAISVGPNVVGDGALGGASIARLIGEKGTVLGIHGIPSTSADQGEFRGYKAAFARCPGVTFNSSIVGQFQIPVAKQQLLTYLSSHPQPVAGVTQPSGMGPAVIQAFQQTGRTEPALLDGTPTAGDLAYWKAHAATFKGVAAVLGPPDLARATAFTVSHLLSGHGPKVSALVAPSAQVTASNLSQFVIPGAGVTSQAQPSGPLGTWLPDSYLAPLFNK